MERVSTITKAQAESILREHEQKVNERKNQAAKTTNCPVCGAARARELRMSRFETDIITYLRSNRIVTMDSCILCVQKHVGRAMQYYTEMLTASGSGKSDGTAAVNVKLNHLKVIGELGCAIDESADYTDLNTLLKDQERQYRYEGVEPDWKSIAELIVEYEQVIEAAGALKSK